ncbi:MAG: lamin tail domain-containing protein [Candidatus Aegiribacteria sp.]|nr:lamin tail domain-containing protein [Candidatus Aegiribacteria sp.]
MDLNTALALLAVDNLTVNLDSYAGRCCNYYLYQRDRDELFVFSNWDLNEAWGIYNSWGLSISELQTLDPFWLSLSPWEYRPLGAVLWDIEDYEAVYTGHIQRLMAGTANEDILVARMEELRDLIRDWVYAEQPPMRLFTPEEFENAMTVDIMIEPGHYAPALETFIRNRHDYLTDIPGTWNPVDGLVLNELMAKNDTTISDNFGEYDDWIEITNSGAADINLKGFFLTDNMADPFKFAFPDTIIQPGDHFIIWADDDPEQGSIHADFKLDADGEEVYLLDSAIVIDEVTFPELDADIIYGLWPDGTGEWEILSIATPGYTNEGGTGMTRPSTGCTDEELQIFLPNPLCSAGAVTLQGNEGYARLDVYDMSGRLVDSPFEGYLCSTESFSWDVTSLSTGIYFLRLSQGEKMVIRRITVMR